MDTLIGVRGKDFVIIASEMSVDYSIIRLKADEDKIVELDNDKLIGSQGELADCDQFVQLMTKNLDFLKFKNSIFFLSFPLLFSFLFFSSSLKYVLTLVFTNHFHSFFILLIHIPRFCCSKKHIDGQALGIKATANFVRNELAYAIRHNPYQANLLIGGLNKEGKAELYFIDYLGVMTEVNCAGHGYGSMFTGAIFDRYWHKDITLEQVFCIL